MVKGRLFDPRTNSKMAWLHFTERQRITSVKSMFREHNRSVGDNLKIHLAGTNEDEHVITSTGRKRLQSHVYYKQIVDFKDHTYWEVGLECDKEEDNTPREVKKLKLHNVVNANPSSSKRPSKPVQAFVPDHQTKGKQTNPAYNPYAGFPCAQPDEVWHFPVPRAQLDPVPLAEPGRPVDLPPSLDSHPVPPVNMMVVEPPVVDAVPIDAVEQQRLNGVKELVNLFNVMRDTFGEIIAAKDETIAGKDETIAGKDAIIAGKDAIIAAKDDVIRMLQERGRVSKNNTYAPSSMSDMS